MISTVGPSFSIKGALVALACDTTTAAAIENQEDLLREAGDFLVLAKRKQEYMECLFFAATKNMTDKSLGDHLYQEYADKLYPSGVDESTLDRRVAVGRILARYPNLLETNISITTINNLRIATDSNPKLQEDLFKTGKLTLSIDAFKCLVVADARKTLISNAADKIKPYFPDLEHLNVTDVTLRLESSSPQQIQLMKAGIEGKFVEDLLIKWESDGTGKRKASCPIVYEILERKNDDTEEVELEVAKIVGGVRVVTDVSTFKDAEDTEETEDAECERISCFDSATPLRLRSLLTTMRENEMILQFIATDESGNEKVFSFKATKGDNLSLAKSLIEHVDHFWKPKSRKKK